MSDVEVQVEAQLENSPLGQHVDGDVSGGGGGGDGGGPDTDDSESLPDSGPTEADDWRWLLADDAVTPRRVKPPDMDLVRSMRRRFYNLLHQAVDLKSFLLNGQWDQDTAATAAAAQRLLGSCEPFFWVLESEARSTRPDHVPDSIIKTRLLEFSQLLCDKLQELVSILCCYNLLSVDDTQPHSVSPFCLGQAQLGHLRVTTFRYWEPMPYLAHVSTGLYKRMRWNVERLRAEEQTGPSTEGQAEHDYYFLCFEDIPSTLAPSDDCGCSSTQRMWSIGLWVQVDPNPTDNIYDWILCEVPYATYHKLLLLGSAEPSSCNATDYLLQLLLSQRVCV